MEIQIKVDELKKCKVFLACPMYGGNSHGLFVRSCLDLQASLMNLGIECRFSFLFNESLITRARNYLVDEFLRNEQFTHLLFIDSDISFDPKDVITMLALDKDVIGGPYPKKTINWRNILKASKHPSITEANPNELSKVAGDYVFNPIRGTEKFKVTEPLEVLEIGTGFMLIKRDVFPKFAAHYPHLAYKPDHPGQKHFDGSREIHAYFDTVIDPVTKRYLSEDYMFCQYWRNMGGSVWLCPWMQTTHVGSFHFEGNLPAVAGLVGSL